MNFNPLRRLFSEKTLFNLDVPLARGLVPLAYGAGLFGVLLWALNHLFWRFGQGWGNGLWGLLEIAGFGLLLILALRILAEAALKLFANTSPQADAPARPRLTPSMLDEVRDAIQDLGEDEAADTDDTPSPIDPRPFRAAAHTYPDVSDEAEEDEERSPAIRRTARRSTSEEG